MSMRKLCTLLGLVAAMVVFAQTSVTIQDQKMVVTRDGESYVLTPNGEDASYFWASVSPDEQHLVYVTARYGTFVCDIDGLHVQSMGRMNAPKWIDNRHVAGMQEFYTGHDEIDHIRYIARSIDGRDTRDLSTVEQQVFVEAENVRLAAEKKRQAARLAARREAQQETGLKGIKIYINPGHGGHDANDRSIWTIPVPEVWTNPKGYWESNSNLVKGLALCDMLEKAGATVIMSRTTNKSGNRDVSYYPNATAEELEELRNGDDRDLSAIAEEANANNVDHFISIHSNALNSQTNYLLMLYHGRTGEPTVAQSDQMAASSGEIQITNPLTVWTSPKPILRGDLSFYGDDMGLGVLRPLTVPGFLSEGSFHDYAPETHRLCNDDYCKLEALRMYQHFHKWFKRELPQTATISGWVKSSNELVDVLNQPKFVYVPNSDDQWLPLNGAKVELYKGDTKIAEKTTDDWYNGVFAFYDLEPGDYRVVASKAKYSTLETNVTVKAEEIAGVKMQLKNIRLQAVDYPCAESDAMALDNYEFEAVGEKAVCPAGVTRALYRNGKCYMLIGGAVKCYNTDMTGETALPMPADVVLSDIGFSADNYLVGKVADKGTFYMWDEKMENPTVLFDCDNVWGNSFAISGAAWCSQYVLGRDKAVSDIQYNADAEGDKATVTTREFSTDYTGKQLTIDPFGKVCDIAGVSFFCYAGHYYMARPVSDGKAKVGFRLYDVTEGMDKAQEVSSQYPEAGLGEAEAAYMSTMAWVDGYTIHVIVLADGEGVQHFQSLSSPVANIYAGELDCDGTNFYFRLNEDASNVSITIEKDNEIVDTHVIGALSKGAHKVANPFTGKAFDHYSITASARAIAYPAKISTDDEVFQFYAARGVAVDKTPSSPYFGRVYVSNSVGGECSEGTAPSFRNSEMGVFVLGNDLTDVTNQGGKAYTGEVEWGENVAATNYQFALARPTVAPNGDVFVPSTSFGSAGVYVMNPAKPDSAFTPVFSGKRSKSTGQIKSGSKVITNPVMSCVVLGTGKDEVLYTYDRDNSMGTVYSNINQYNIGEQEALPWTTTPSAVFFNDLNTGSHMQNGSGELAYDQRGGFFMSQYRYNSSAAIPALIHVNAKGEIDFNIANNGIDGSHQGGMGISADGNMIAIGAAAGTVKVWDVTYNETTGAPSLTEKCIIEWDTKGNTMGVDFDAAGNLYIVSNSNERLMVYALPNTNNTYTTRVPVRSDIFPMGVDEVNADTTPAIRQGIYTVTGQYLGIDESQLPAGMYIINGKKVIK